MGKGGKDTSWCNSDTSRDSKLAKKLLAEHFNVSPGQSVRFQGRARGSNTTNIHIPPGIPECDVLLTGENKRCKHLELMLFLFGLFGLIVSAIILLSYYM